MRYALNTVMEVGGRWFGICLSSLFALLSWFCLLQDLIVGFVFSIVAMIILLLSLFRPRVWMVPVKFCLVMSDAIWSFLLSIFLFCVYFLVISPVGLLVGVFDSEFFFKERIHRSRKYRCRSLGSYWENR